MWPMRACGGALRGRRGGACGSSRWGSASAWSQVVLPLDWAPYVTTGRGAMLILRWSGRKSCVLERLSEVFPEVVDVLQAHGEADEGLRDAVAPPPRTRLGQRLDPAAAGRRGGSPP